MLSEFFVPHWTGLAKSFFNLARDLARDGHAVTVLTTRHRNDLPPRETIDGIDVHRSDYLFSVSRTHYSLRILRDAVRLSRRCDVVIINSPFSNVLFAVLIAKLRGKRTIVFHQGDLVLPRRSGSRALRILIEGAFDALTLPAMAMSDVVATYTQDYARHSRVMRRFPHKLRTTIPTIDVPAGRPSPAVTQRLDALRRDAALVGFAGRFVEEKGFDVLFRAIPEILRRRPDARFAFAGEQHVHYERFFEQTAALLARVEEHVTFLGLLDAGDLAAFYRSLDAFVLCSRSDCFALTQAEAALCGAPLVVSDIPGARCLVQATGAGVLVAPEDPHALATGVLQVLDAPASYARRRDVEAYLARHARLEID